MIYDGVAISSENDVQDSVNFFITDLLAEESALFYMVYTQILAIHYHDFMQFVYHDNLSYHDKRREQ